MSWRRSDQYVPVAQKAAPRYISRVEFSVASPEELKAGSVVSVTEANMFDGGNPKPNSLLDLRMGPYDKKHRCLTCTREITECPGHYGLIELVDPAFHPCNMPQVVKILKSTCFACCRLMVPPKRAQLIAKGTRRNDNKLTLMMEHAKKNPQGRCPHCFSVQPKWSVQNDVWLYMTWPSVATLGGADVKKTAVTNARKQQKRQQQMQRAASSTSAGMAVNGQEGFIDVPDTTAVSSTVVPPYIVSTRKARHILAHIPPEDCILMGLGKNRPQDFILTVLVVPPPQTHPPIISETARGADGLTKKLGEIIVHNGNIRHYGSGWKQDERYTEFQKMQYHIATLMNRQACGSGKSLAAGGRLNPAALTYMEKINGKEGLMRGNIMGKRTENAARGVITPDPNMRIHELSVPYAVAVECFVAEVVTALNIARLTDYCLQANNPKTYPRAVAVRLRKTSERIDLLHRKTPLRLSIGDKVSRNLITGDLVPWNRQPSLHRLSIMAFLIRVVGLDGKIVQSVPDKITRAKTFSFNTEATPPFNADFDGDEMNMHVINAPQGMGEMLFLMALQYNLLSPATNKPCIAWKMDAMLSAALLSRHGNWFTRAQVMQLLVELDVTNLPEKLRDPAQPLAQHIHLPAPWPIAGEMQIAGKTIAHDERLWSGKQIISMLFPYGISFQRKSAPDSQGKRHVLVCMVDGNLIKGSLDSKLLGSAQDSLVHMAIHEGGGARATKLIHDVQLIGNKWFTWRSYSIGIKDCVLPPKDRSHIQSMIGAANGKVDDMTATYESIRHDLVNADNLTQHEQGKLADGHHTPWIQEKLSEEAIKYEASVNAILNKARNDAGVYAREKLPVDNRIKTMVEIGSKGNVLNLAQITSCVGQQNLSGQRLPLSYGDRTFAWSAPNSTKSVDRGNVENSYFRGLTGIEFMAHSQGGREGVVDTGVKTSKTGYFQRRMTKVAEDLVVAMDGTVRNSMGKIVQFMYGEDGCDGMRMVLQNLDYIKVGNGKWEAWHRWCFETQEDADENETLAEEFERIMEARSFLRDIRITINKSNVALAAHVQQFIQAAKLERNAEYIAACCTTSCLAGPQYDNNTPQTDDVRIAADEPFVSFEEKKLAQSIAKAVYASCQTLQASYLSKRTWRDEDATCLLRHHIQALMSSKKCIRSYRFTLDTVQAILHKIEEAVINALVAPGESVGILMAQGIGEPSTQMTLNTFHQAGMTSKAVCMGVPRLEELTNASEKTEGPSNIALVSLQNFEDGVAVVENSSLSDESLARLRERVADATCCRTLESVTVQCEIISDSNMWTRSSLKQDNDTIQFYRQYIWPHGSQELGPVVAPDQTFEYCLRFNLSKSRLMAMNMDIFELSTQLRQWIISRPDLMEGGPAIVVHAIEFPAAGNILRIVFTYADDSVQDNETDTQKPPPSKRKKATPKSAAGTDTETKKKAVAKKTKSSGDDITASTTTKKRKAPNASSKEGGVEASTSSTSAVFKPTGFAAKSNKKAKLQEEEIPSEELMQVVEIVEAEAVISSVSVPSLMNLAAKKRRKRNEKEDPEKRKAREHEFVHRIRTALLQQCILKGLAGIDAVSLVSRPVPVIDPRDGRIDLIPKWHIETEGLNLKQILQQPFIDPVRAESNNPLEVFRVFGICAARIALAREITLVLTYDGAYINVRYPKLLADLMTHGGFIMPMTRFGNSQDGASIIKRATFEQTSKEFINGSIHNETDMMRGPSEALMVGRPGSFGTGLVALRYDREAASRWYHELHYPANTSGFAASPQSAQAAAPPAILNLANAQAASSPLSFDSNVLAGLLQVLKTFPGLETAAEDADGEHEGDSDEEGQQDPEEQERMRKERLHDYLERGLEHENVSILSGNIHHHTLGMEQTGTNSSPSQTTTRETDFYQQTSSDIRLVRVDKALPSMVYRTTSAVHDDE